MSSPSIGKNSDGLSIGQVARSTGIPIETLRFYDRSGLLGDLPRTAGGHRVFDSDALGLLDVVVRLRRTGMAIEDLKAFVHLVREDRDVSGRISILRDHHKQVREQMDQLTRDLGVVEWKIAAYTAMEAGTEPPSPPENWPDPVGLLPNPDNFTNGEKEQR
ncbi:MerR family transcriptional regulator [Nesterenkonia ebinurensis]|uniref:MerR family transcriptional regulator n=1 Tax=Nesterenkonia ebinurensis TaxID=2608252 RepID=UPI00123E0E5D|nr:MerR family transcriptional regulator [Nesterenkonia ebinurensis]